MNRRDVIMLSGVALAAHRGMAQVEQISRPGSAASLPHVSPKVLLKYSRPKSASKVPKTEAKTAKYLSSLNALLALSAAQQQQATSIFAAAATAQAAVRNNLKAARQSLNSAIRNNDTAAISQASTAIGGLKAQLTAAGANANAAFYVLLTADQQSKLTQFKS